jgi:hypothetical protein
MSIEQIIKDKFSEFGGAGYNKQLGGTVHIAPSIKEKTAKNAADFIAEKIDPSSIIVVIDTTLFGSAKEGYVFTTKTMYRKRTDRKVLPYNKIVEIEEKIVPKIKEVRTKTLTIYDKDGNNIFEEKKLRSDNCLCELLNAIVPESQVKTIEFKPTLSGTVKNKKAKKFVEIVYEMLQILGWYSLDEDVYFLDIPPEKLANSKKSLEINENETVIILFDRGKSAKEALVFTDWGLRSKHSGERTEWSVSWKELSLYRYRETTDYIYFQLIDDTNPSKDMWPTEKRIYTSYIGDTPWLTLISIAITVFNSKHEMNTYEDVIKASEDKMQYNKTVLQGLLEFVPYVFPEPKKEEVNTVTDSETPEQGDTKEDTTSTGFFGGVTNLVKKGMGSYKGAIEKEKERMQDWPDTRIANVAKSKSALPAGMAALQLLKERGYTSSDIAKM